MREMKRRVGSKKSRGIWRKILEKRKIASFEAYWENLISDKIQYNEREREDENKRVRLKLRKDLERR